MKRRARAFFGFRSNVSIFTPLFVTRQSNTSNAMNVAILLSVLLLAPMVFGGWVIKRVARDREDEDIFGNIHDEDDALDRVITVGLIAASVAIAGGPVTAGLVVADNDDGTRSCWTKILDKTDITDQAIYDQFMRTGLPMKTLLEHTDGAIYAPMASCPAGLVVRNRRAERFMLRPTAMSKNLIMYHAEKVPNMIEEKKN